MIDIEKSFAYHPPKNNQPQRYEILRSYAKILAELIDQHCPKSIEKDQALMNLKETIMWANASIAINE